jgi:hypothetical protein
MNSKKQFLNSFHHKIGLYLSRFSFCLLGLIAVIFQLGCADDDFRPYVELGGLRVLAIQADVAGRAEASPGETVVLTPYVSDYGVSRALAFEAKACLDLGIAVGVEPSCDGVPGAAVVASGAVTISGTERTGSANTFSVTVPSGILTARSAVDRYNGVYYLVTYKIQSADGASVQSFKRIVVSEPSKSTKNSNPSLAGILGNGSALVSFPSGDIDLSAQIGPGSQESYDVLKSDLSSTTRNEEMIVTWFISQGELNYFRTVLDGKTNWKPGAAPAIGGPVVVGVLRDSRGGVDVFVQGLSLFSFDQPRLRARTHQAR